MPDITDLLHGAAPEPMPFDEDGVRARVAQRARRRKVALAAVLVVVVVGASGLVLALNRDDDRAVVTNEPPTTSAGVGNATALAIVADQIWIGGDGFVSLGDGSTRVHVPGPVEELAAGDDGLLWVRGAGFVSAVDTGISNSQPVRATVPATVVGTWTGDATDLVPLPSGEVAITSASSDEVVIAKTSAIAELEEVWRIPVRGKPSDIVRTTKGEVWVRCDDGISELDVGAQGVKRSEQWSGPLLAPALDGGIWTTDGDRLIDLTPGNLSQGVSVAEGARYDIDAAMVVETSYGVYVGGPAGVKLFASGSDAPQVVYAAPSPADAPTALAASGGQIVYLVGGAVREGMATQQSVDPQAWQHEPRQVAARYLSDELHWPDVIIDRDEFVGDTSELVYATSASLGRDATVLLRPFNGVWRVMNLSTIDLGPNAAEDGGSISLGQGSDYIRHVYAEDGLTPELLVRYGDHEERRSGTAGESPNWEGDLGWVADTEGFVQILWRNADGVALEGWARTLPKGPFSVDG